MLSIGIEIGRLISSGNVSLFHSGSGRGNLDYNEIETRSPGSGKIRFTKQ